MELDRRLILNGIVATGLVGLPASTSLASRALASDDGEAGLPTQRAIALVNDAAEQSTFLQGIAATPQGTTVEIIRADFSVDFVQKLNRLLRSRPPVHIIGLVDDGTGAFVVQMARATGARLPWLAQHAARGGKPSHYVMNAGSPDLASQSSFADAQSWPAALGSMLALFGGGHATAALSGVPRTGSPPLTGTFVSFLIEP
ncbi:hypothetical protein [Bradyrhizobium betae]|uniref:Uncharacterized protein n=1 Tax=Bradyrhizobium betae TaxID=244734 RepID=A0A5P6P6T5_9BRAD|nr:hypothetical protein [Bradyrhizobium betae]MCS3731517.1 hypothetical protein [Bradyrhizobium betae]QFI74087.1 hypothetical protein F8237_17775 [Bradyrhizobium betae]